MSLIPNVIPLWVKAAAVGIVFAIAIGFTARVSYKYGYNERDVQAKTEIITQKNEAIAAQQMAMVDKQILSDKYNKLATELLDTQFKLAQAKETDHVKIVAEIQSNPVYKSCVVPPSGVRIISDQAKQLNAIRHQGSSQN